MKPRQLGGIGVPVAGTLVVALILAIFGAFSIGTHGTVAQTTTGAVGTVRFVHASPDAPRVDVVVDNTPIAQGLSFGAATEYASVPSGDHQVQLVPSGQSGASPLVQTQLSVDAGKAYIVAALGPASQLELQVQTVNLDALEPGQSRVRLVNAIPDGGDINVGVPGGDTWFDGVGFKDATDYDTVGAGTYDLAVSIPDSAQPVATVPGVALKDGGVYDIFALGEIGAGTVTLLPLETLVSQPCSAIFGVGTPQDACVRFVNASPDAPAFDVYVGGMRSVQGLQFNGSTDFVNFPAGNQQIQFTASGSPASDAVIDTQQELRAGQAYQIIATGTLEEIEATVNEVDLTPLPVGQARLRFIHASPDAGGVDVAFGEGEPFANGIDFRDATEYQNVDVGSNDLVLYQAGQQTEVLRTPLTIAEGMVYDVVALGRAQDRSLKLLVLTAATTPRQGGVATPIGTPITGAAPSPAVGAPAPIGTPASPVAPPVGATTAPATPVPATPIASPDIGAGLGVDVTETP